MTYKGKPGFTAEQVEALGQLKGFVPNYDDAIALLMEKGYHQGKQEECEFCFSPKQIQEVGNAFWNKLKIEQIELLCDPSIPEDKMHALRVHQFEPEWPYKRSLTLEEAKELANSPYNAEQVTELAIARRQGLSPEQIAILENPDYSAEKMCILRICQTDYGDFRPLTLEEVRPLAESYDAEQIAQIVTGIQHNLTPEQIDLYRSPDISWERMADIRLLLENGPTEWYLAGYLEVYKNEPIEQALSKVGIELSDPMVEKAITIVARREQEALRQTSLDRQIFSSFDGFDRDPFSEKSFDWQKEREQREQSSAQLSMFEKDELSRRFAALEQDHSIFEGIDAVRGIEKVSGGRPPLDEETQEMIGRIEEFKSYWEDSFEAERPRGRMAELFESLKGVAQIPPEAPEKPKNPTNGGDDPGDDGDPIIGSR